jgi:hypothetical protein
MEKCGVKHAYINDCIRHLPKHQHSSNEYMICIQIQNKVKVKVMLRPTTSQSVRLGVGLVRDSQSVSQSVRQSEKGGPVQTWH